MKLYTGDNCPVCDNVKQYIKENSIEIDIIHLDLKTREGRDLAMDNRIMGVPVLIKGDKRYVGTDVIKNLYDM